MRKIVYKGKSKSGEWIHGSLVQDGDKCLIDDNTNITEVNKHTVGLKLNVKDRMKNDLFEGDSIILKNRNAKKGYYVTKIVWSQKNLCFLPELNDTILFDVPAIKSCVIASNENLRKYLNITSP